MCLSRLTQKRTLKKDKQVWKIVRVVDGKDVNRYTDVYITPTEYSKSRVNNAVVREAVVDNYNKYNSGFHCYLKKSNAIKECPGAGEWADYQVRDFIIPKNTAVQYGVESDYWTGYDYSVIVTPVLINPRIPE